MNAGVIRVVIAKVGLDAHDKGARLVARALKEAGMEVIYTGLYQTPEQVAETAVQEDADLVGISVHTGAHMTIFPRIRQLLDEKGAEDVILIGGGTMPDHDVETLKGSGLVAEIFPPQTLLSSIEDWVKRVVTEKRKP